MNAIEDMRDCCERVGRIVSKPILLMMQNHVDRIEKEYIELPKDKNGKVIKIGDTFSFTNVLFHEEGLVGQLLLRESGWAIVSKDSRYTQWNVKYCEIIEPDSQEKIDADAELSSCNYCDKYHLSYVISSIADPQRIKCKDLLRRQRELLERKEK
jgi:hypothetical protein